MARCEEGRQMGAEGKERPVGIAKRDAAEGADLARQGRTPKVGFERRLS